MIWKKIRKGYYHCPTPNVIGIIERSEAGFWWWGVFDAKSGKDVAGGRRLKLGDAKRAADPYLKRGHLKAV